MENKITISIYKYFNYRTFLKDFISEKKKINPYFSHRGVLQKMGITSSGFLANVISGKSNLTIEQVKNLGNIFKLSKNEIKYFKNLIYFSKAKTIDEKNDFFENLLSLRKGKYKFLEKEQLSLFSKWYYVVIREYINFHKFTGDFKSVARNIEPSIKPEEAKQAIYTLEKLGLIKKGKDGIYFQTDASISTGDEVKSMYVANYQIGMIDLAKKALEKIKPEDRDISGLTLTVSQNSFKRIKEEIQGFRKKIAQIAVLDNKPDRVLRCNFQIFPVTKFKEGIDNNNDK